MRWIYISPHLDDAVLSCGGLIWEQRRAGTPVEIWTLTAGYPSAEPYSGLARALHAQWGFASAREAVQARRREDRLAAQRLGAVTRHFDFLDCIYRLDGRGRHLYEDVFVPPHPEDTDLPTKITKALTPYLGREDVLVSPLAIGGHVDHVLVRRAVERLRRSVWYYADIPYLLAHPESLPTVTSDMSEERFRVSGTGLRAWQEGIAAYASQIAVLFESEALMREAIHRYWSEYGGVRLWRNE
ncbi:MAG: PIG-L family deacetylase [Anaerolineae bacterium]|nr:MAG: PIG-L family deacetylase [Anaerolineae bacterium]